MMNLSPHSEVVGDDGSQHCWWILNWPPHCWKLLELFSHRSCLLTASSSSSKKFCDAMLFPAGVVVLTLVAVELCLVRGLKLVLEVGRDVHGKISIVTSFASFNSMLHEKFLFSLERVARTPGAVSSFFFEIS